MSGIIFLIILSFLVIIHEMGHFLFARWSKIKVEEFGLGYPPKAKTLFKDKLGTIYTLNWLPFGGFVRMFGEDGGQLVKGSFSSVSVWKRLVVVLAGATINFIFGVLAFGAIYSQHGIPTNLNGVRVEVVAPGSPAELAGVKVGELVTSVSQSNDKAETKTSEALISFVQKHRGEKVILETKEGPAYETYVRKPEEVPTGEGALGLTLTDFEMKHYPWWEMPFRGMWVGLKAATSFGFLILDALGKMVSELVFMGKVPADVSGPVGIVYTAEKEGFLREGFWSQLNFAAILSINLAIVNVLPFPALDGGRAVFLVWELLTRKRVNQKVETWLNTAGFALLLSLIVLISVRDVGRVFQDQGIQRWFLSLIGR
jgi:regulator of sigma E protease